MAHDTHDTLTQDNEPNPWRSIGLQAALIVNKLRCDAQLSEFSKPDEPKNGNQDSQRDKDRAKEDRSETERADMERRVRDILGMEDRLRRKTI